MKQNPRAANVIDTKTKSALPKTVFHGTTVDERTEGRSCAATQLKICFFHFNPKWIMACRLSFFFVFHRMPLIAMQSNFYWKLTLRFSKFRILCSIVISACLIGLLASLMAVTTAFAGATAAAPLDANALLLLVALFVLAEFSLLLLLLIDFWESIDATAGFCPAQLPPPPPLPLTPALEPTEACFSNLLLLFEAEGILHG